MQRKSLAIATPVGSFKGAFAHGVLTALEEAGIVADAYAAASSSVIPASWAAIGRAKDLGINYWLAGLSALELPQQNMSKVVQRGIRVFSKQLRQDLYQPQTPTLFIATNAVINPTAAAHTQTHLAQDLGKRLLRASVQKDRSWVDTNLRFTLFSTHHFDAHQRITPNNYPAVAYASSRIMHAWEIPAWIDGKPYVDAAYTCLCPVLAMVSEGYQETIAISNEPGMMYRDMFHIEAIPSHLRGVPIHVIRPDVHLKELGVDFTKATPDGLVAVYRHGRDKGAEFVSKWR
ncbi:hypothetical protein [Chamaesiphon minutus]|uniref:PNPLA domain-containing protein n=1 Tax=Chamaesiphon minutus (strain ATCC 27169 / PCC 6605) TaxID=1173020 RepID=K9UNP6_CHAP6|nr:hypothetical protein [Chamaesiphon minutus]AFY96071.1 hypothetical protein Cha6605_5177 [Chamaesiphon minutus PCC 6605]